MRHKNIQVSIITVNYKIDKELLACISSIIKSKPKILYEIIIVDNDEDSKLGEILQEKFPKALYVKSPKNLGYGGGNNLGASLSKGEFLFFLNPDTVVTKYAIDTLFNFANSNSSAGMVAPLLFDPAGNVYQDQGSDQYNLINSMVVFSFINKYFPHNKVSEKFFHSNWDKKEIEEFDVVPGTAFMIKKELFYRSGMFDEKFFLYFEEYDLAKRIKQLGYKNYIIPKAKILHVWEASTKKRNDIDKIFSESRDYFFKKNYGVLLSLIINFISKIGRYEFMLGLTILFSVFLGLFRIGELMTFIGDQGWFYISARDIFEGKIPLVGIASSRPWLHQGPLWTYILAIFMWAFNFNPVSGAYASVFLGFLSVIGIYILGTVFFSKRVGLISSLLYATSPLVVFYMRLPYHTSGIPVFVIGLIFSLHKIVYGRAIYIPIALFSLGILYNFEIATAVFWPIFLVVVGHSVIRDKSFLIQLFSKKILILSLVSLTIPMLPMLLYDIKNGFPQTAKFGIWIFYKIISFFGFNPEHAFSIEKIIIMFAFLSESFTQLIFVSNNNVSIFLLIALIGWAIYFFLKKNGSNISHKLILFLFFLPLLLIIFNQTPSEAYLPMLLPTSILLVSAFLGYLSYIKKMLIPTFAVIIFIVLANVSFILKNNFSFDKSNNMFTLGKRIQASREILNLVKNKDYKIKGIGPGSEHESFTANYEYLTWWLGHGPSKKSVDITIIISESKSGISIGIVKNNFYD